MGHCSFAVAASNSGQAESAIKMAEVAHHLLKARESANEAMQAYHEESLHPNARWTRKYIDELPDSHFFYVDKQCASHTDSRGRSHPLSCRFFPYIDKQGYVDPEHVRNAISRAPVAYVPEAVMRRVQAKARGILKELEEA